MWPLTFHGPNNCHQMGEMGKLDYTQKYSSPHHLTASVISTTARGSSTLCTRGAETQENMGKKGRSNPAVLPGLCWANGTGFHSQTARQVNKWHSSTYSSWGWWTIQTLGAALWFLARFVSCDGWPVHVRVFLYHLFFAVYMCCTFLCDVCAQRLRFAF